MEHNDVNKKLQVANEMDLNIRRDFHKSLDLNHNPTPEATHEIDLNIGQGFHKSLDLSHNRTYNATLIHPDNPIQVCFVKVETGNPMVAIERRLEMGVGRARVRKIKPASSSNLPNLNIIKKEIVNDLELDLNLPPPKEACKDESLKTTPASSRNPCLSLLGKKRNPDEILEGAVKFPSLILMGCCRCRMYAMVSEVNPQCPKCKSSVLINIFRPNPVKRSRTE